MNLLFILLIIYQIKHFLADYPLQNAYMLGKFKGGKDWILPLLAHVSVHGLFTLAIVLCVNPSLWWLSLVDFGIHFVMDRIKASPNLMGRWKALTPQRFKELALLKAEIGDECWPWDGQFERCKNCSFWDTYRKEHCNNKLFWWALGIDQMVHHLTHYLIIWFLVTA